MSDRFFSDPILNSPYEIPALHWELHEGIPTQEIAEDRRRCELITPIPKPKKRGGKAEQQQLIFQDKQGISDERQQYDVTELINSIRDLVGEWRTSNEANWRVTPETARLLKHWRHHEFAGIRPFFCQVEAVETSIWLTEVAPQIGKRGADILGELERANDAANPGLFRIAHKLATGAGKTTVMAMLIAWQTINAVRRPASEKFTKGFLVVAPGLTIKDRLRVLQPNDPNSYFKGMELVPQNMLADLGKAKIVITNYHAFRKRELLELAKGTRQLLQGRGEPMQTTETEGQMIQRVMPELMGLRRVMVLNDEAHHCYREKPLSDDEKEDIQLDSEDKTEAKKNSEAARLWISGLEAVSRKIGISRVTDLSATPFFLSSSGYVEGTLFPWTSSDFSLMDAIECGIVKLPRVPVADNVAAEMPRFRKLWENIKGKMPKKGRGSGGTLDPENLPTELKTALKALYGHYEKTFDKWEEAGIEVPPCFIIVCNNTSTSKLVYDWVSGYERRDAQGDQGFRKGDLPLFWNHDEHGTPLPRPRTLLIDSEQLESGEALDKNFRELAESEIELFRRERVERDGAGAAADTISDAELLREVMNTVGKPDRLGQDIRCVVSVAMLSEGWDANTVTHVLGVRAFGTQLLCEQVVGRALRRQSYELNPDKDPPRFDVEYADIFGIPFDFTAQAVQSPINKPKPTIRVYAVRPERDAAEISFPNVLGYRVELPNEVATATFHEDHHLVLSPDLVGPGQTSNQGIIGEEAQLDLEHTKTIRRSTVIMNLAKHLVYTKYRDAGEAPKLHLILPMKKIVRQWLDQCLECKGGMTEGLLLWREIADMACNRIVSAIMLSAGDDNKILAMIDPYNPTGSSRTVNFTTSKTLRWQSDSRKSHVNWAICDSTWEQEFCRVLESQPQVRSYVKNQGLGFEVPYNYMSTVRRYIPDFIAKVDDGHGDDDLLNLVCEVKGYRGEDAKDKRNTMETFWVPGVNNTGKFGRWAFAEFRDVLEMDGDFAAKVEAEVAGVISTVLSREVN